MDSCLFLIKIDIIVSPGSVVIIVCFGTCFVKIDVLYCDYVREILAVGL